VKDAAMNNRRRSFPPDLILTLGILLLALALRLTGPSWDQGYLLHPDERFLTIVAVDRIHWPFWPDFAAVFDPARSPLNPRALGPDGHPQQFAYGSLPLYVVEIASWIGGRWLDPSLWPYTRVAYIGRFLTALVDVSTVLLAMLFARRAFGRAAALLAGLLLALSVITIQQAHFFVVDPWTTLFTMATLLCALRLAETSRPTWAILAGASLGAALATKASIALLAVPVVLVIARPIWSPRSQEQISHAFRLLAAFGGAALVVFALFEPYALLAPRAYLADIRLQWRIATGQVDVPYTLQYVGTTPGVYQVEQLVKWGLGPGLGIACLVALVVAGRRWWRTRDASDLILLSWIVSYSASIARAETKYLRYLLPIVPPLVILAGAMLASWIVRESHRFQRTLAALAIGGIVLVTAGWTAAFTSIYWQPHPRIAASRWMLDHIPRGATVGVEHWDDALPLNLREAPGSDAAFRRVTMTLYDVRPNEEAFDYLASTLEQVDYIVLSSDRVAGSIPRLPWRYPVTAEYYRLLESGQLGFQLVYESRSMPQLGPLRIDDLHADESFTVYDHPRVRIYRKVQQLSRDELRERFAWALAQPFSPGREQPPEYKTLLGRSVSSLPAASDLGWSVPLTDFDPFAVAWWLLIVTLLGAIALPLSIRVFPAFPDHGFGFARLLGLVCTGYLAWIFVSLDLMPFTMPWLLLPLALMVIAVTWIARLHQRGLVALLRRHAPFILASEAAFWFAFCVFLGFRWLNPDLWHPIFGGEKPMELAYINAIARSLTFPPYDPWFADGTMNYYYYGFYLVAFLWKLTGVSPDVGFQLSVATLAGFLASGLLSLGAAIGRHLLPGGRSAVSSLAAGGMTVLLGLFTGNLDALRQVISRGTWSIDFWQSSRAVTNAITEFPFFTFLWADLHPHAVAQPLIVLLLALVFSRWLDARHSPHVKAVLMAGTASLAAGSIVVTNTWDTPLAVLLVTAFAFAPALGQQKLSIRSLAAATLRTAGILGMSWLLFYPFFARFVAVVGGIAPTSNGTAVDEYLTHFGIPLGLLAAAALWWLIREGSAWQTSIVRTALFGASASLAGYCFGNFVFAIIPGVAVEFDWLGLLVLLLVGALAPFAALALSGGDSGHLELLSGVFLLNATAGLLVALRPTAGITVVPCVLLSVAALRLRQQPALAFVTLAAAAGLWITLVVDLVLVVDDLFRSPWERMNTVFKFYLEAWLLFTVAAGAVTTWLLRSLWQAATEHTPATLGIISRGATLIRPLSTGLRVVGDRIAPYSLLGGSIVLLASGLIYPILGTPQRLAQRMPTTPAPGSLDGYAWMRGAWITNLLGEPVTFTDDYYAIQWLREHAPGNAVIVEASIGPYRGNGARISSATGLPAVLGWDRHQRQQRQTPEIDRRLLDVRELYSTTDLERKRWLLRRYRVRYVIIGDVERRWRINPPFAGAQAKAEPYTSEAGLVAFEQLEGTLLRRVFESGSTIIYEVLPFPSLPPTSGADGP
jgi:YYY domain-containing protein